MAPVLDVIDSAYVVAAAADLRPLLCDESEWERWFPDLTLRCYDDRGSLGKRWVLGGALVGTGEVWLEQLVGGTVVHLFWQADPPAPFRRTRALRVRLEDRYARRLRAEVMRVKDRFDAERPAGRLRTFVVPRAEPEAAPHARPARLPRDRVTTRRARRRARRTSERTTERTSEEGQPDGRADHE